MNCTILSKREAPASPLGTVLALGCFDGFHRGHRALIETAKKHADALETSLAIWSPIGIKKPNGRLTSREDFLTLASSLGVDLLIEERFEDIRALDGKVFFERYILEKYRPAALVCGENFRFGQGARCTAKDLAVFCKDEDLPLIVCPSVTDASGEQVSSTAVKSALSKGDIPRASSLLGRNYTLGAVISKGRQVGRTLGFPTINLPLFEGCPLKYGVYFAYAKLYQGSFPAIVNVGVHPTFGEDAAPVLEAHLLNVPSAPIAYGEGCTIEFLAFRRAEMKFSTPEQLQQTVFADIEAAKAFFA